MAKVTREIRVVTGAAADPGSADMLLTWTRLSFVNGLLTLAEMESEPERVRLGRPRHVLGYTRMFIREWQFCLTLQNRSPWPMRVGAVKFVYDYEALQPETIGGLAAKRAGGAYDLASGFEPHPQPHFIYDAVISPGDDVRFTLPSEVEAAARSIVASLSPERFRINVSNGPVALLVIPGAELSKWLTEPYRVPSDPPPERPGPAGDE
jgi:hypothetical protein